MKTNQIFFPLLFLFILISNATFSQEGEVKELHSIDIPKEYKSAHVYSEENSKNYKVESKYFTSINVLVTITIDDKNLILLMQAPKSVPKDLFKQVGGVKDFIECYNDCNKRFWCVVECALDHL
ncbi:hypothetical protein [Bizionia sp.]|uniref:hypothetical protein n=1 Tax=Bizionia sp. TaxID=1954480 RepID=UPI003A90BE75